MLGENPNLIRIPNRISSKPMSGGPPARVHERPKNLISKIFIFSKNLICHKLSSTLLKMGHKRSLQVILGHLLP